MESRKRYSVYEMIPTNGGRVSFSCPLVQESQSVQLTLIAQRSEEGRGSIFQRWRLILYLVDVMWAQHLPFQPGPRVLLNDTVQEVLRCHVQLPVEFHGGKLDEAPLARRQSDRLLVWILFLGRRMTK